jgi:HEAT repeat protein
MADRKLYESAMIILRGMAGDSPAARFPLHWLSDLNSEQAAEMACLWPSLPAASRRYLMGRMEEEAREKFELDFVAIARIALDDADPEVRMCAIRTFWECEDTRLVDTFLGLLERDSDAAVRAAAASALGLFVERSELEEIDPAFGERIVGRLVALTRSDEALDIRRRAVESLGYSSDPRIRAVIENAFSHAEEHMRASALLAMGRSADAVWAKIILGEIGNRAAGLRAQAAKASGSLGLRKAVPLLIELLEDVDSGVRFEAIAALGEIGGEPAREALEEAQRQAVGEEWERIERALENAEFQDSLEDLPMMQLVGEGDEDADGT